ncbi:hypothetical protein V5O48_011619 [Marasmius crinis-equi]|uniref:Uncharacterized protein n=1 Tax=Marasmius crinis-equi TaxID=585013 RepID=A0ABR3F5I1_9AGAR
MRSAIALAVLSAFGALAQVTMNVPTNLAACQPAQLNWSGGKPPYFISVQDANNPTGTALERFDNQQGTSLTWTVNFAAGTSIGFLLRDSEGSTSQTAAVTIQAGSSTNCIGKEGSFSNAGSSTTSSSQTSTTRGSSGTTASTSSEQPIGAIIGGVLGGVAVLIATAVILVILLRRRRQKHRHSFSISELFDPPPEPPKEQPKPLPQHHIPGTTSEKKGVVMLQRNDFNHQVAEGRPQTPHQTDANDSVVLAEMRVQFELMSQRMARMEAELGPPDYASRIAD